MSAVSEFGTLSPSLSQYPIRTSHRSNRWLQSFQCRRPVQSVAVAVQSSQSVQSERSGHSSSAGSLAEAVSICCLE